MNQNKQGPANSEKNPGTYLKALSKPAVGTKKEDQYFIQLKLADELEGAESNYLIWNLAQPRPSYVTVV